MASFRLVSCTRINFEALKHSSFRNARGLQGLFACFTRRGFRVFSSGPTKDGSNDSEPKPLYIDEIKDHLWNSVAGLPEYWRGEKKRLNLPTLEQPKKQDELPAQRMKDSSQVAIIPVGTDKTLRQRYLTFFEHVRLGKILEDLDVFASWIAYLHIHGGRENTLKAPSPHTVVTAVIDRIDLHEKDILPDYDIQMSGNVTWVGESSMEVSMKLRQFRDDGLYHLLDAQFIMVSRDLEKDRKAIVNPLLRETKEEEKIFRKGKENHNRSIANREAALSRKAPTAQESEELHNLMLKTFLFNTGVKKVRPKMDNVVLMEDAKLSSVFVCNPQQRNIHNKVFGGYLLKQAFNLSWANACLFSRSRPIFSSMDDVWFRKSVEIGSILEFTSQIVYTPPQPTKFFQVMTVADVIQPKTGERKTTNVFYYTFESENEVPTIAPITYKEAMLYVEGKRRFEKDMLTNRKNSH